jgi:TolA-binding protein
MKRASNPSRLISTNAVLDFLYQRRWYLGFGAFGVVLLLLGFWGYSRFKAGWETEAQALLTAAIEAAEKSPVTTSSKLPVGEVVTSLEEALETLRSLRDRYSSTEAAGHALLQIGDISYRLGRYRDALTAYQRYLEQYPRGWAVLLGGLGKGHALEALGQLEEAAATFRSLTERYKGHSLTGEALTGLGRCLERLMRQGEAKEVYQRIIKEYPGTPWSRLAERRLAGLER